ncbi:PepSY domain-containing protein [Roseateles sp. SL47]|uniref:PepSY-associated TM helix domain-containing protein n=1 Tax=Roseateles sp. SL47 TaxID=2995138 RepID=UPI00226FA45A|nr:PepSY domain-containing protein [Roseateles sp. SL47]WAC73094.1 PepSY domain-containing protein [Roseateles sp. SL47]
MNTHAPLNAQDDGSKNSRRGGPGHGSDGNGNGSSSNNNESALYRRVWRWHFYAGLVCLPFLILLAVTGGLYLFKDPIEHWIYRPLLTVDVKPGQPLSAEALVDRAMAAQPGTAVRFVSPAAPGRSAEVGIQTSSKTVVAVYMDPIDGRVLGEVADASRLMTVIKHLHSLALAGKIANLWIEVVAGWAMVLVVSGLFLWWPRGRSGGVLSVRGQPRQRLWWRDLHAVTGCVAAAAILFLAVTGMPWSAFWGEQFGRLTSTWGVGTPRYVWGGAPPSTLPLAGLPEVPWSSSQAALPRSTSGGHEGHEHHEGHEAHQGQEQQVPVAAPPASAGAAGAARSLNLDQALQIFARMGLPAGTPVRLPSGPQGVYSAMRFPDDVRDVRVVHLDRYSGAVLADIGLKDYGAAGRLTEWGISLHTGRQFGLLNQLLMLAGCLSIVVLAVSSVVMWWKRRPRGRLAAPPRRAGDQAAVGAVVVAALLGLLYPLLGASMLVALLVDTLLPGRWRQRFGL